MRVLVVTTFYAPDLGAGAALFTMLCEDLVRMGHEVSVIAAVPHYPTGQVQKEFRGRFIQRETRNGVDITRVWVPSGDRSNLFHRLVTFSAYQVLAGLVTAGRQCDVTIGGNPALEVFLPFMVQAKLRRRPAIFSVHDLYPDAGVKLGIFRHRPVISFVGWLENICMRRARYVRVLSDGFHESLRKRGLSEEKLVTIWDWLDTDFIKPLPQVNSFSREFGFDEAFTVEYAGNLGFSQGLEHLVDAAEMLSANPAIKFALVGDGAGKRALLDRVAAKGLDNVRMVPFQPRARLPEVLGAAHVSIVSLLRGMSSDSVPSKLYSILASGRPVIAAVDADSDTARMIARAGCGLVVPPEDPTRLADAIGELYNDAGLRSRLGESGRAYVLQHHGRQAAAQAFSHLLSSIPVEQRA